MKKILGVIVLGLLLSGNAYAADYYQGKHSQYKEGISKIYFCDTEWPAGFTNSFCRKASPYFQNGIEINDSWKVKGQKRFAIFKNVTQPIRSGFSGKNFGNGTFHAIAYSWSEAERIISKLGQTSNNSQSAGISFTIKDKKEQCAAIGFKPETDKFADCVLRLVELDVKKQQSNKIANAQNSGNEALVKQLQRQEYDRGTDALLNLGQQLLQPKSSTYSTCSYIDLGSGMSKVKCN